MKQCPNCEEDVPRLVVYDGDTLCERCAAEWKENDISDAAFEYHHNPRAGFTYVSRQDDGDVEGDMRRALDAFVETFDHTGEPDQ